MKKNVTVVFSYRDYRVYPYHPELITETDVSRSGSHGGWDRLRLSTF